MSLTQAHYPVRLEASLLAGADRWLMFGDYGAAARYNMKLVWVSIACFLVVDAIWLPMSRLTFAASNWTLIITIVIAVAGMMAFCALVNWRLRDSDDRIADLLRIATKRAELLWRALFVIAASAMSGLVFCYLATSAALPLQDELLAAVDRYIGFDWLGVLTATNAYPVLSRLVVSAYKTTDFMIFFVLLWLSAKGQGERLSEFLALLSMASVGVAIGMMIFPAAGAYAFYKPLASQFSNFSVDAGMWHYQLFTALRSETPPAINFAVPNGMVTFPSFHTVLGIITTYALRDSRWTLIPALAINAVMIFSTLPEGGHHLIDLFAGAAIAFGAIAIVRLPAWRAARAAAIAA